MVKLCKPYLPDKSISCWLNPLSTKFRQNSLITKFNEFAYFTGVTSLARLAFQATTNLEEIEFPTSLVTLGAYSNDVVFSNCKFISIDMKNVSATYNGLNACTSLVYVNAKNLKTAHIGFQGCSSIKRIVLPNLATRNTNGYNGGSMLRQCTALELADIGSGVTYFADYAIGQDTQCTAVLRSKNFTISKNAFYNIKRIYCTSEMYDYLHNSSYNNSSGRVYVIGGTEWVADFGSSDVWADLTQEEYDYYYKDIVEQGSGQS